MQTYVGDWRALLFRGIVAILFGLATLFWPGITLLVLVVMWGAFALADGLAGVVAAVRGDVEENRWWWGLYGLAGIVAGVVTFAWPGITALALLWVIAVWAFVAGVVQVVTAIRLRRELTHAGALGLAGVLSIVLGGILVFSPATGLLGLTWAIAGYAALLGVLEITLALAVRREQRSGTSRPVAPPAGHGRAPA